MSNLHTATLDARSLPLSARPGSAGVSVWRRIYNAWIAAYGNRMDENGNIICEM